MHRLSRQLHEKSSRLTHRSDVTILILFLSSVTRVTNVDFVLAERRTTNFVHSNTLIAHRKSDVSFVTKCAFPRKRTSL